MCLLSDYVYANAKSILFLAFVGNSLKLNDYKFINNRKEYA